MVPAGAAYLGVDPGADPRLLHHRDTIHRYLEPAIKASAPLTPAGPMANTDIESFLAKVALIPSGLGDLEAVAQDPLTAAVSISALEHIDELGIELGVLRQMLTPEAKQLHLVNFSNHLDKAAPFKHLYDLTPEEHRRRYGRHINLMRPQEVLTAFKACGFEARLVPVDVARRRCRRIYIPGGANAIRGRNLRSGQRWRWSSVCPGPLRPRPCARSRFCRAPA